MLLTRSLSKAAARRSIARTWRSGLRPRLRREGKWDFVYEDSLHKWLKMLTIHALLLLSQASEADNAPTGFAQQQFFYMYAMMATLRISSNP